jgi:hypothetical protein
MSNPPAHVPPANLPTASLPTARPHPASLHGAVWTKSSHSGPTGGNCVELAHLYGGQVAIRNSRHRSGPALLFTAAEWDAFLAGAKNGEFDRPET